MILAVCLEGMGKDLEGMFAVKKCMGVVMGVVIGAVDAGSCEPISQGLL